MRGTSRLLRVLLFAISLGLLLGTPGPAVLAQSSADIELHAVDDPVAGVASVVPEEWKAVGGGLYAAGDFPADPTLLAIQSSPLGLDQLWPGLLPQLLLDEIPEPTGELSTVHFDWLLYHVPVTVGAVELSVELALAEGDGATHIVLLQAPPGDAATLREAVFVPAIEAYRALSPDPTPDAAALGYRAEEVSFSGGSDGVELAGTLTLPTGGGPHPAVVLMSGSGPQDRDESLRPISAIKPFALIAATLTSAGLAVLRYDDRGVGESTGDYASATIQELAADGGAALAFLREHDDIDPERVGLLGHSEGGLYAAMLAADDPAIAFVVALAGPAVEGVDLLVAQMEALQRSAGAPEAEAQLAASVSAEAMPLARDGDEAGLTAVLQKYLGQRWDLASETERQMLGDREAFVEQQVEAQVSTMMSDWYRSLLAYDPAPDWRRVSAPVLGIFGGKDVQVLAEQNAEALRAALAAGGNEDVEIVVLPDANHLFQSAETGSIAEYGTLPAEFTPDLLPTIVAWLTERAGLATDA